MRISRFLPAIIVFIIFAIGAISLVTGYYLGYKHAARDIFLVCFYIGILCMIVFILRKKGLPIGLKIAIIGFGLSASTGIPGVPSNATTDFIKNAGTVIIYIGIGLSFIQILIKNITDGTGL